MVRLRRLPGPSRRVRLWLAVLAALALAAALAGRLGGAFAFFSAETQNGPSRFTGGWLAPPTNLAATISRYRPVNLAWTAPGTHGSPDHEVVWGAEAGTAAAADCSGLTQISSTTTMSTSSYSDSTPPNSATDNGHWWCYEVRTTRTGTSWYGVAHLETKVGLAPLALSLANGDGTLASGDALAITFTQQLRTATATRLCVFAGAAGSGVILVGDTTCSTTGDTYTLGKLTGLTISGSGHWSMNTSTSAAGAVVTVSITGGTAATVSGTATFVPASGLQSAATPRIAVCSTALASCSAQASSGF